MIQGVRLSVDANSTGGVCRGEGWAGAIGQGLPTMKLFAGEGSGRFCVCRSRICPAARKSAHKCQLLPCTMIQNFGENLNLWSRFDEATRNLEFDTS